MAHGIRGQCLCLLSKLRILDDSWVESMRECSMTTRASHFLMKINVRIDFEFTRFLLYTRENARSHDFGFAKVAEWTSVIAARKSEDLQNTLDS